MTRSDSRNKRSADRTCMEAALAKLSYRMRTENELRKALEELEFDSGDIDSTIDELKTLGYIDDERYVREFYRSSRRKNWSKNRMIR
ncbi:MAG: RecX family transcriptional regulator, partial [Firmicutes bacterium]|nr:RecX family transcriptional regulator [Bacillota bacterium]